MVSTKATGRNTRSSRKSMFSFMQTIVIRLRQLGKVRTSETYLSTLNSFARFVDGKDVMLNEMNSELMTTYEAYLKARGVGMNTVSFYMRILRAVYNRAVDQGIVNQCYPFKHVYTGVGKTAKRAVPLKVIKQIKEVGGGRRSSLTYACDMFLFSFYTRGMSFVDMAYLRKKDLKDGVLSYRRRKTGQLLSIRWEKCMQDIIDKYPQTSSPYLLPIIRTTLKDGRRQYKNSIGLINRRLKEAGKKLGLSYPLTMYVARHSWASIAKDKNIPVSIISESMGHDSEKTTLIYLASLDATVIDNANMLILSELM